MFKRIRQYIYIQKIRITLSVKNSHLKYLMLDKYKSNATRDFIHSRITGDFYYNVFCNETPSCHYTEVNAEAIKNYKF